MNKLTVLLCSFCCSLVIGCPSTPAPDDVGPLDGGPDGARDAGAADAAPPSDVPPPIDAPLDAGARANGVACTSGPDCVSGACVDGVCCESACEGVCMACSETLTGAADGTCAPTLSVDPEDECSAEGCLTGACSATGCELSPEGHECRPASGACDVGELCSGASAACPPDVLVPAETICRSSAGGCDVPELCSGADAACPADDVAAEGTSCRAAAGVCDVAESCDGSTPSCPGDVLVTPAMSSGLCGAYLCSGAASACPTSCATHADCVAGNVCSDGTCVRGYRVFVTSTSHPPTFGSNADTICRDRATAGGLGTNFRAWISDATGTASARLAHVTNPLYRMDGTTPRIVATSWADLVDGISVAIATDEFGIPHRDAVVWTGTFDNGGATTQNCTNWSGLGMGTTGNSSAAAFSTYFGVRPCTSSYRLYCFEQPPAS